MNDPIQAIKPRFLNINTPAAAVIGFVMSTIFWAINPTAFQIAGISRPPDFYGDVYLPLASLIVSFAGVLGSVWPIKGAPPLGWWRWVVLILFATLGACMMVMLSVVPGFVLQLSAVGN